MSSNIYTLRAPCSNCPFRSDITPFLTEERAEEIADSLEGGATFYCHKTLDYDDMEGEVTSRSRACAGSMITMERDGQPNQIMRIAERIGMYDPTRLEMDSPVFDSLQEWKEAQR